MPRWLLSAHAGQKCTAPSKGLIPSARAHGATCQLQRPTPSQRRVSRTAQVRQRSLSLERGAALENAARAPSYAGCGQLMSCQTALRQREASLLRFAPVLRRARPGFQRQAPSQRRVPHGAGAPALAVTREEWQHLGMMRARAVPRWSLAACAIRQLPAPTRGRSFSSRARGAACKLRSSTPS